MMQHGKEVVVRKGGVLAQMVEWEYRKSIRGDDRLTLNHGYVSNGENCLLYFSLSAFLL